MKTSSKRLASIENVSQGERVYRGVASLGLVSAVLIGGVSDPAGMFAVTLASIYLGITAIMAIDPLYSLVERLAQQSSGTHHRTGQTYA